MSNISISTDRGKLDLNLIYSFLNEQSYWAKGRSLSTIERSVENSICFGAYDGNKQVGFARVVTDHAVFAWIMDVFVIPEYRNMGIGKMLMEEIMDTGSLQNIQRWGLATDDAHELYRRYGFRNIEKPEIFMEKVARPC